MAKFSIRFCKFLNSQLCLDYIGGGEKQQILQSQFSLPFHCVYGVYENHLIDKVPIPLLNLL